MKHFLAAACVVLLVFAIANAQQSSSSQDQSKLDQTKQEQSKQTSKLLGEQHGVQNPQHHRNTDHPLAIASPTKKSEHQTRRKPHSPRQDQQSSAVIRLKQEDERDKATKSDRTTGHDRLKPERIAR